MKSMEIVIGTVMRIGLWISVLIVLIGGILFLLQNGNDLIHYQTLRQDPFVANTVSGVLHEILSFSAEGWIWLGLLILVLTQIIRVALIACLFLREKDYLFAGISLAILAVLICTTH